MTVEGGAEEHLETIHGRGVGEVADAVVKVAQERGYSVAATGPGQFRMIRERRPAWAVVAAILTVPILGLGLLFLLVKKTESGTVAVFEGRDGTKVRFVGQIDREIINVASAGTRRAGGTEPPPGRRPAESDPVSDSPVRPAPQAPPAVPQEPSSPAGWQSQDPPRPIRDRPRPVASSGSGGLIEFSPLSDGGPSRRAAVSAENEKTVARPTRYPSASPALALALPDSRRVLLADGVVIGRSPTPPDGTGGLRPLAYPDASLSKTHLMIVPEGAGVKVTDLHSTNGTILLEGDVTRLCPPGEGVLATAGSVIHAGDVVLRVEVSP